MSNSSYRKIDYRLRPAKHIERSLFAESFKNIPFHKISDYEYVGFGSLYFSDFRVFHKEVGIDKLISIEKNSNDKERFEYNKPFSCIDVRYGHSSSEIPKLDWESPKIIWLDYDGTLNKDVLGDIRTCASNSESGTFLAVSINAEPLQDPKASQDDPEHGIEKLIDAVGKQRIPAGTKSVDLSSKGTAKAYYDIVIAEVQKALSVRNACIQKSDQLKFMQCFHIKYADGAPMLTIGGFLANYRHQKLLMKSSIVKQLFYRNGSDSLSIDVPLLTLKEVIDLEMLVPVDGIEDLDPNKFKHNTKAPNRDVVHYLKTYRFLPNYLPVQLV